MFKIRDWLYICGFPQAQDNKALTKEHIKALLLLYKPLQHSGIDILYLPVSEGVPLPKNVLEKGVHFVKAHQQKKQQVCISCGAGVSRSVTFGIAALHEIEGLTLREAFLSIRQHNPEAMPDHIHWQSLSTYYNDDTDYWTVWQEVMGID